MSTRGLSRCSLPNPSSGCLLVRGLTRACSLCRCRRSRERLCAGKRQRRREAPGAGPAAAAAPQAGNNGTAGAGAISPFERSCQGRIFLPQTAAADTRAQAAANGVAVPIRPSFERPGDPLGLVSSERQILPRSNGCADHK